MAAKLLQLLTALDPDKRLRKAQPLKVFLLRFRQDFSRSQTAITCECSESLVAKRLSAILARLPWQPRQEVIVIVRIYASILTTRDLLDQRFRMSF